MTVYKVYEVVKMFIAGREREIKACGVYHTRFDAEMHLQWLDAHGKVGCLVIEKEEE